MNPRRSLPLTALALALVLATQRAHADDAAIDGAETSTDADTATDAPLADASLADASLADASLPDASLDEAGDDAASAGDDSASTGPSLACDGALCDTTNGATCQLGHTSGRGGAGLPSVAAFALGVGLIAARRKKRRAARSRSMPYRNAIGLGAGILLTASLPHRAMAAPVAIDVAIDEPTPHRSWVIDWNPLPAFVLQKASFDLTYTPKEHHTLLLSPYFASISTAGISLFTDPQNPGNATTTLPVQTFTGGGLEAGYRYYWGAGGPRGFYLGGSLILGLFDAHAANDTHTTYWNFGLAADAGYQILIDDRLVIGLGAGLQGIVHDKTIPNQQYPVSAFANAGVLPRVLGSIGWAFR
jgi:hypothetical protein